MRYNLKNTILVKIHQTLAEVPVDSKGDEVENNKNCERSEKVVSPIEDVEGAVAEEGDVDVIAECNEPQGVSKHG